MSSAKESRRSPRGWMWIALGLALGGSALLVAAPPERDDEGVEFFEKKIRPLLAANCYACHSQQSEKPQAGLRLDTTEGLLKGGNSGPAILPGDPEKSRLIRAVRYIDSSLRMPPASQLPAAQVAVLEAWVKMGAPVPRQERPSTLATSHWAFQPVKSPPIPAVKSKLWVQSPVDAFILAKLESKGLSPALAADKRTLIRRASYDLIGLPPTPEEVSAFLADKSPAAFAKVVDRLLASPQYGERWGRHWLDLARYANTKGDTPGLDPISPHAFSYRDYVIRAFNEDLPYSQFILQQIAADQLDLGGDKGVLAALGFITVGRRFLNNIHDTIADRIDVVTQGLMGLTVSCARCHDHKYDPIPTRDYYSLYGIFANSSEPAELPILSIPDPQAHADYLSKRKQLEENVRKFVEIKEAEVLKEHRKRSGEYLFMAAQMQSHSAPTEPEAPANDQNPPPVGPVRWKAALETWKKEHHPIFAPWFAFAALSETEFAVRAKEIAARMAANSDPDHPINPLVAKAFAGESPASLKEVAERCGKLFQEVDTRWLETLEAQAKITVREGEAKPGAPTALPDPHQETVRQILYGKDAPGTLSKDQIKQQFNPMVRLQIRQQEAQREKLDATHPGSPPRAMALEDSPNPKNSRVFIRGNPDNLGEEAPPQFLEVLAGEKRRPFQKGSGRLELAQAIASRDNPLTARVVVNWVWLHHFGAGLVTTASDFGLRSDPPSHPELLDYLAWRFMADGWSLKKLHRLLMLSSVYQQKSDNKLRYEKQDPDNRLLAIMNRRRLDFESLRDTLLFVTGNLDRSFGGRPVYLVPQPRVSPQDGAGGGETIEPPPLSTRRSVYGFIDRQALPGLFRVFDFADPDATTPVRLETTVPQQALFFLNGTFVMEQAKKMLERPEVKQLHPGTQKIRQLYQLAYQRDPSLEEIRLGLRFIRTQSALFAEENPVAGPKAPTKTKLPHPWEQYAQVLLMSNELMFVD